MRAVIDGFVWFFAALFLFGSQVSRMLGYPTTSTVFTGLAVISFAASLFVAIQEYRRVKKQTGK